jgi:hypothetical protein
MATSTELDVQQRSISAEPIAQDVQATSEVSLPVTNDFIISPDDLGFFYSLDEVYSGIQSAYEFELDIPSSWPPPWQ